MSKASIAIFKKNIDVSTDSQPACPDEVFLAAERVSQSKLTEIVKCSSGFFVISFSENGPFSEKMNDDWLPVYIARVEKWSSGGVKVKEMQDWVESKKTNEPK